MLVIRSTAEMADALASSRDVELKRLLAQHRDNLADMEGYDLGELARFVVVDPSDTAAAIEAALGFDPATNLSDGTRLGEPSFNPSWEWRERHELWTELVFVLSDDGFGCVLLIPDLDGVDPSLSALCRAHA